MNGYGEGIKVKALEERVAKLEAQLKFVISVAKNRGAKIEELEKLITNTKIANDLI